VNYIQTNCGLSFIGGGANNVVEAGASAATIPGGTANSVAGNNAFAAGSVPRPTTTARLFGPIMPTRDFPSSAKISKPYRARGGVGSTRTIRRLLWNVSGSAAFSGKSGHRHPGSHRLGDAQCGRQNALRRHRTDWCGSREQFDVAGRHARAMWCAPTGRTRRSCVSLRVLRPRGHWRRDGAGDIRPGQVMHQPGTLADGEHPVTMLGRAWSGVTRLRRHRAGRRLTSSDTPGHAMKSQMTAAPTVLCLAPLSPGSRRARGLVLVSVQRR